MSRLWDVFCRVIDNHGDLGVCWRLARDLAARGERVRLWVDDASALCWMAPRLADACPAGIELRAWPAGAIDVAPGDVVIEAFGCELPPAFVERMAVALPRPAWVNLEYLSAEAYVERSHGLASPQFSGPGTGLSKRFFYPGFTLRTGGLLREPGLLARADAFDGRAWLAGHGWAARPGERVVSLFAYANPRLPQLLDALGTEPTLLLVCPGRVQADLADVADLAEAADRDDLRCIALPYLPQDDYDHLLWACDLNFVRGEDSFVRAQWASKPWVWQIYPQDDGAHAPKLEAFMAVAGLTEPWRAFWRGWNGLAPLPALPTLDAAPALRWRAQLAAQADLVSQLLGFVGQSG
jgi:uncharacterized repeat protein (TIGR03837 family)